MRARKATLPWWQSQKSVVAVAEARGSPFRTQGSTTYFRRRSKSVTAAMLEIHALESSKRGLASWGPVCKRANQSHAFGQGFALSFFGARPFGDLWLYSRPMTEIADTFDSAFTKAVDLGNRLADRDKDADLWDIADGLLAGALQYWLYSRQPCGDPRCQDCMPISTAEGRMAELKKLVEQLAAESEYFHTPTDANAGRA